MLHKSAHAAVNIANYSHCDLSAENLISRLERNRPEFVAAPPVQTPKSPIPELNSSLLFDKQTLLYTLRSDFESMVDHAKYVAS